MSDERMGEVGAAFVVNKPGTRIFRRRADLVVPRYYGQLQSPEESHIFGRITDERLRESVKGPS